MIRRPKHLYVWIGIAHDVGIPLLCLLVGLAILIRGA